MKAFIDFVPVAAFVAVYYGAGDFFLATIVLMAAVGLQVVITWLIERRVSRTLMFTFWIGLVFGGLTLLLHDRAFLFWKPTIINWTFAAVVLGSELIGRSVMRSLLGAQLELPARAWRHLAFLWTVGFLIAGGLNLYVAYGYSEAFWVGYKLWGGFTLSALQIGATIAYLWHGGLLQATVPADEPAKSPAPLDPMP